MLAWILTHTPLFYFSQSLWRDEAFSILAAERPLSFFFTRLTFEPPVYYILLHFWIKLFGNSEIAARSLSLTAFALSTYVVIIWAEKLFQKHFLSWVLPLLFFFNPMLLYYAFEVRAYAWYVLFSVLSMYTYMEKKWQWFVLYTVLGFYTHTYFIFVPIVQVLHWVLIAKKKTLLPFIAAFFFMIPWLGKIVLEATRLRESWYYPVNFGLVKSVLGNMFLGYEGTPWYLWKYTAVLSLILLFLFFLALARKTTRPRNLYFFLAVIVPLIVVIAISFLKPLFVNRYLLPVTIGEVFLLTFALESTKNKSIQKLSAAILIIFSLFFNMWYPKEHPKLNIRKTILEVNALKDGDDIILSESPLIFFESLYYGGDRHRVFLYNPAGSPFPWYVGDAIVSSSQIARDLPPYPIRAFLIHEDGSYDIAYQVTTAFSQSAKRLSKP